MSAFRNKLLKLVPRWAASRAGTRLWAVLSSAGDELDRVAFFQRWSFLSRLVETCHPKMLTSHGTLRKLARYALDDDDTYRTRLIHAWEFYRMLGTSKAIVAMLSWLGYRAEVICAKDLNVSTLTWTPVPGLGSVAISQQVQTAIPAGVVADWRLDAWDGPYAWAPLSAQRPVSFQARLASVVGYDRTNVGISTENSTGGKRYGLHYAVDEARVVLRQFNTDELIAESPAGVLPLDGTGWLRIDVQDAAIEFYYGSGIGSAPPVQWTQLATVSVDTSDIVHAVVFQRQLGTPASIETSGTWANIAQSRSSTLMWNCFWVRVWGIVAGSWNSADTTWNAPEENWNVKVPQLEELRKIVLRCRAAYNLFVGFILVQVDGSEVHVNFNDE